MHKHDIWKMTILPPGLGVVQVPPVRVPFTLPLEPAPGDPVTPEYPNVIGTLRKRLAFQIGIFKRLGLFRVVAIVVIQRHKDVSSVSSDDDVLDLIMER